MLQCSAEPERSRQLSMKLEGRHWGRYGAKKGGLACFQPVSGGSRAPIPATNRLPGWICRVSNWGTGALSGPAGISCGGVLD